MNEKMHVSIMIWLMVILKDLSRRVTDKILCNKAFANVSNQQYHEYQYGLH